jgi:hypothetical protein
LLSAVQMSSHHPSSTSHTHHTSSCSHSYTRSYPHSRPHAPSSVPFPLWVQSRRPYRGRGVARRPTTERAPLYWRNEGSNKTKCQKLEAHAHSTADSTSTVDAEPVTTANTQPSSDFYQRTCAGTDLKCLLANLAGNTVAPTALPSSAYVTTSWPSFEAFTKSEFPGCTNYVRVMPTNSASDTSIDVCLGCYSADLGELLAGQLDKAGINSTPAFPTAELL